MECVADVRCQSFNCAESGNKCELNDQRRETRPSDFGTRENATYFGPTPQQVSYKSFNRRPFPSSTNSHFQSEAKCQTFPAKMSFIWIRLKNYFHLNRLALSLALKQRLGATQKWPSFLELDNALRSKNRLTNDKRQIDSEVGLSPFRALSPSFWRCVVSAKSVWHLSQRQFRSKQ